MSAVVFLVFVKHAFVSDRMQITPDAVAHLILMAILCIVGIHITYVCIMCHHYPCSAGKEIHEKKS